MAVAFLPHSYFVRAATARLVDLGMRIPGMSFRVHSPAVFKLPLPAEGEEGESAEAPSLVAFSRVVGDGERFAYLADVFVLPEYRGLGLGKAVVVATLTASGDPSAEDVVSRDSTQWKWILFASKAKDIYIRLGFQLTETAYELAPGTLNLA
ncbi:hypothetical protein B0H14DRAFT_3473167 [Mycena olivaceomarginata]|nr:hypothetical protein B0H14DRAFT_3473167 [Mycena olivaceomarginata]